MDRRAFPSSSYRSGLALLIANDPPLLRMANILPSATSGEQTSARPDALLGRREARQLERLLAHLVRRHVLVLDELGYVLFSKAGAELLFEVVSRAYGQASLVIKTNLPFER
jgi:hypothetical protein